ncbi:MAG: hypothetical protein GQ579_03490, partial [Bacteroidales bacterium]|nr:hypothetical protein [Bacteroidales bacterium]
ANLKQDYMLLDGLALMNKNREVMQDWYGEKKKNTYIRRDIAYSNCTDSGQQSSHR